MKVFKIFFIIGTMLIISTNISAQTVDYLSDLNIISKKLTEGDTAAIRKYVKAYENKYKKIPEALVALGYGYLSVKDFEKANLYADWLLRRFPNFADANTLKRVIVSSQNMNNESTITVNKEDNTKIAEGTAVKTEIRCWYSVDIPTTWNAKQYASEMIVKKDDAELNFKEEAKGDLTRWLNNINKDAKFALADITTGDITWKVFKNVRDFKTVYITQMKDGVVRVGSSIEDVYNADVLKILGNIKTSIRAQDYIEPQKAVMRAIENAQEAAEDVAK